jgi:hypothetical protein
MLAPHGRRRQGAHLSTNGKPDCAIANVSFWNKRTNKPATVRSVFDPLQTWAAFFSAIHDTALNAAMW